MEKTLISMINKIKRISQNIKQPAYNTARRHTAYNTASRNTDASQPARIRLRV